MNKYWSRILVPYLYKEPDFSEGVRHIFRNCTFDVPPKKFFSKKHTIESLGYKQMKISQLKRYYLVEEDVEKADLEIATRIKKRKYGSVTIRHHGMPKKHVAADFCMISTTVTYDPRRKCCYVDINWRSMEAWKRGRADFIFLRDVILSRLQKYFKTFPVAQVRFNIISLTIHPMYFVLTVPDMEDWKALLKDVQKKNPSFARKIMHWNYRYLLDERPKTYSSEKQVLVVMDRIYPNQKMHDDLRKFTKKHYEPGVGVIDL
jgi:hypothetical protein